MNARDRDGSGEAGQTPQAAGHEVQQPGPEGHRPNDGKLLLLIDKLKMSALGLCSEDLSKYIPRGVTAADCIEAARQLETLSREIERAGAFVNDASALVCRTRSETLEEAAKWHEEQAAKHAALQASAELVGGERTISAHVGAGRMIVSHDGIRKDHERAAAYFRSLTTGSAAGQDT